MNPTAITERFRYHPPSNDAVIIIHVKMRDEFMQLAHKINVQVPDCPEKEKAIDSLDLACMHVNAAIARTQLRDDQPVNEVDLL